MKKVSYNDINMDRLKQYGVIPADTDRTILVFKNTEITKMLKTIYNQFVDNNEKVCKIIDIETELNKMQAILRQAVEEYEERQK